MCCYAGKLLQQPKMNNPTLVVVTDRNDLDGQLYQQFCAAKDLLKQTPEQAESREQLREMPKAQPLRQPILNDGKQSQHEAGVLALRAEHLQVSFIGRSMPR